MFEIVSALVPPLVVGGAFIAGIVKLMRYEAKSKIAESGARAVRPSTTAAPSENGHEAGPESRP